MDVAVIKEKYGKQKRRKVQSVYDPRPLNLRVSKPEEQAALLVALQKEPPRSAEIGHKWQCHEVLLILPA